MLNNNELSTLFSQLSMLVGSGVSTLEAFSIIQHDMEDAKAKALITEIHNSLESGQELFEVLKGTGEFPNYSVHMIRIGSYSGKLDEVLHNLATYYDQEEQIANSVRLAITYPIIMIFMLLIVVGVLIGRVLPIFQDVYQQLGTDLTGMAKIMINLSNLMQKGLSAVIIILLVAFLIIFLIARKRGDTLLKVLITSKLSQSIAVGRFANGMHLALSSGLDTDESLRITSDLTNHPTVQQQINFCQKNLAAGIGFFEAISTAGIFSSTQNRMIAVGMKSGNLDQVMEKIAAQCVQETDSKIQGLLGTLEPTLVAILAVIVGIILLSIMLPLMGIMSSMGL